MLSELIIKISADTVSFQKDISETINKLKEQSQKIKEIGQGMSTYITLPIIGASAASIKFASDTEESLNKVRVAFGDSANSVISWSNTTIDSMGLAQGSALDTASTFGDMATSMGLTKNDAAKMSMSLTQLGADLSSFKNIPIDQAMSALAGVFTGETESLKTLGVIMTETQLKAFALSQGIQTNVDKMSQAELVSLRYAYVLNQTKNAQGDFARTNESTANQMRTFSETLKELAASFGKEMLPVVNSILSKLSDLAKEFSKLDPSIKKIIIVTGLLAAAIGPLLVAIGSIGIGISGILAGITALGGFAAASTVAVTALGALALVIANFYIWNKVITEANKNSERFAALWEYFKKTASNALDYVINKFNQLIAIRNTFVDTFKNIASNFGSTFSEDIANLNKELEKTSAITKYNELLIMQKQNTAEVAYQTRLLTQDTKDYWEQRNKNQGQTEYMTSYEIIHNLQTQKSIELNQSLIQKTKDLTTAREDLKSKTIESINKLGSALETALKNQYDKQESLQINSLKKRIDKEQSYNNDWLERNKKALSDWEKEYKKTSDNIVSTKKSELETIQNNIDYYSDEAIKDRVDRIKKINDLTKKENQDEADLAKQNEIEKRKFLLDNFNANKMNSESILKTKLDAQISENELNRNSEKEAEKSAYEKLLIERKLANDLEQKRFIHDYNMKLQSTKTQEEANKVVADYEYKKAQDLIDSNNELLRLQEQYNNKIVSIDEKYNSKNTDINSDYQKELSKTNTNLLDEKNKTQEEYDKLLLDQKKIAIERSRQTEIDKLQKEIDDIKENNRLKLNEAEIYIEEQKKKDLSDLERLNNQNIAKYNANILAAEADNERLKAEYDTKKTIIEEKYKLLNETEAIQAEIRKQLVTGQQNDIVSLLKSYYPQWLNVGQSLGEQLLNGLNSKKKSISDAVAEILKIVNKVPSTNVTPNISSGIGSTGVFSTPTGIKSVQTLSATQPEVNLYVDSTKMASSLAGPLSRVVLAKTGVMM